MNDHPIVVPNAGMVLLNSYVPMLFERLQLLSGNKFTSPSQQLEAVHYLQYLVSGQSETEEQFLPLNKVLCGLDFTASVPAGITISTGDKELMDGLIQAAIAHWSAIGDSSIDGFRGNWLVRDGILTQLEDRWELTVEKRAFDLLLNQAPFSFSIIKFPWMPKTLHVTWPY